VLLVDGVGNAVVYDLERAGDVIILPGADGLEFDRTAKVLDRMTVYRQRTAPPYPAIRFPINTHLAKPPR